MNITLDDSTLDLGYKINIAKVNEKLSNIPKWIDAHKRLYDKKMPIYMALFESSGILTSDNNTVFQQVSNAIRNSLFTKQYCAAEIDFATYLASYGVQMSWTKGGINWSHSNLPSQSPMSSPYYGNAYTAHVSKYELELKKSNDKLAKLEKLCKQQDNQPDKFNEQSYNKIMDTCMKLFNSSNILTHNSTTLLHQPVNNDVLQLLFSNVDDETNKAWHDFEIYLASLGVSIQLNNNGITWGRHTPLLCKNTISS